MKGAGHMPRRTLKATRKLPRYPPRNPHNPRNPLDTNPAAASMVGCESLVSTLENKKTIAERFSARRFLDVQQSLEQGEVHNVIRLPRVENPADGLTKVRGGMSRLLNLLKSGSLVRAPFGRAAERPYGIAYGCTPLISRFFGRSRRSGFCALHLSSGTSDHLRTEREIMVFIQDRAGAALGAQELL